MKSKFRLHQTLHGYERGHTLLASSVDLSPESKRAMLVLSDMSGPRMIPGFETYLTCYPVPGATFCAFARTWYAPEMPRPGCVWTHTLLVHFEDLNGVKDLNSLEGLFVRPNGPMDFEQYQDPLVMSRSNMFERDTLTPEQAEKATALFNLLILLSDNSFDSFVFPSRDPQAFESFVKTFWETAWDSLRKTVTWCTGSIGGRSIEGRPFLLQVVPEQSVSSALREITKAKVVSSDLTDGDLLLKRYPEIGKKYDHKFAAQRFWKFASRCTSDFPQGRKEIGLLIDIFVEADQHEQEPRLVKMLNDVSVHFPEPTQARAFKKAMFGAQVERVLHVEDEEMIRVLVTTKSAMSCGVEELDIDRRAQHMYESNPKAISSIINKALSSEYNQHFYDFLRGVSSVITVDKMIDLCRSKRTLLSYFVSANPNLLLQTSIWRQPREIQEEAIDSVIKRRSDLPSSYWRDLVSSMLNSKVGTHADRLIGEIGSPILEAFFIRVGEKKTGSLLLSNDWKMALRSNEEVLKDWIVKNPDPPTIVMAVLAKSLSPTKSDLHTSVFKKWVDFAKITAFNAEFRSDLEIMGFLLTLGFSNLGPGSEYLVSAAFEPVHDALDEDRSPKEKLPYESWRQLEPHVPSLGWRKDWDKCERLRRALVQKFAANGWHLQAFLESVESQSTFSRLVKICKKTDEGSLMLSELREKVEVAEIQATRFQKEELLRKKDHWGFPA